MEEINTGDLGQDAKKNISTEAYSTEKETRIQETNVDTGRPGRVASTSNKTAEPTGDLKSHFLPRKRRLTGRQDFTRVMNYGGVYTNKLVVLRCHPNEYGHPRLGFSTGRKIGNAVRRNRVKRMLREATRVVPLSGPWDIVIIARASVPKNIDIKVLKRAVESALGDSPVT
ncbi:MAG: ribonuclease P protein component [SAR202 cluster bacterium]|nr:ribonuclease P protein component [SAR202 cluster bacterium]